VENSKFAMVQFSLLQTASLPWCNSHWAGVNADNPMSIDTIRSIRNREIDAREEDISLLMKGERRRKGQAPACNVVLEKL
jgi:hypothetical protein